MSDFVRIRTGVAATSGYSETIDGPPREVWDHMFQGQRDRYLADVRAATIAAGVDAWAEVVDE